MTDQPEKYVFESPHVAALMDVGQARIALDGEAKEAGLDRFGEGYHDFVKNEVMSPEAVQVSLKLIVDQDPEAWATILRASLLVAQGSSAHQELKDNVQHLAVLAVAWLEDINARTVMGIEP